MQLFTKEFAHITAVLMVLYDEYQAVQSLKVRIALENISDKGPFALRED
jgi:hypothetical protein